MKKILLIEDDPGLARVVKDRLKINEYDVTVIANGNEGLQSALTSTFDLMLIDLMLPEVSGFDIIREIRSRGISTPIIILSAKFQLSDKVNGLQLGADDYMVKPFDFEELLARIETNIRRCELVNVNQDPQINVSSDGNWFNLNHENIEFDNFTIDFHRCELRDGDSPIQMSNIEFKLLVYMVLNSDRVVKIDELLEKVWEYEDAISTRTLYVHVAWLRKKLSTEEDKVYIKTVRGIGYQFQF